MNRDLEDEEMFPMMKMLNDIAEQVVHAKEENGLHPDTTAIVSIGEDDCIKKIKLFYPSADPSEQDDIPD